MSEKELDALMARMEKIAAAVNSFNSEAVQKEAFLALVGVFNSGPLPSSTRIVEPIAENEHVTTEHDAPSQPDGGTPKKKSPKRNTGVVLTGFKFIKDLDLRPIGKQSFDEFVAEKQPASNQDRFVVAIYYLQNVLELPKVTVDHVGSIFRLTKDWREPADLRTALSVTSTRKGTITTKTDDLHVTPQGRNFVEHDLPPKPKAKKK